MLFDSAVTTMLPVKDIDRARRFYEGCLGLTPGGFKPDGKFVYMGGGSTLALFPKPEGTKADHTAISFRVPDIAAAIKELKRAGVVYRRLRGGRTAAFEIGLAWLWSRPAQQAADHTENDPEWQVMLAHMQQGLRRLVGQINDGAGSIRSAADEIATGNADHATAAHASQLPHHTANRAAGC